MEILFTDVFTHYCWVVWNFFHSVGNVMNVIIPTDFHSMIFQRASSSTTNQIKNLKPEIQEGPSYPIGSMYGIYDLYMLTFGVYRW